MMLVFGVATLATLGVVLTIMPAGTAEDKPYISPDGYNASLNEILVEFTCLLPSNAFSFTWFINETSSSVIGEDDLTEQGIKINQSFVTKNDTKCGIIQIETRLENDNTKLQCIANIIETVPLESNAVVLKVQGLLDPPNELVIHDYNITHQVLQWSPPFTLDLTALENDITSYIVMIVEMNSSTSNETWSLPGHSLEFFFPRFSFPVWLSVRGENPVGLGAPSPPRNNSFTSNCINLRDAVSKSDLETQISFTGSFSQPSVKIVLLSIDQANICIAIDAVVVIITSDDDTVPGDIYEGGGQSKVLVPKLREKKIILDLEYPLNPHSHYSISLSFPSQHTLFMNFSTHHVQDVIVSEKEGNGLEVECLFAQGCPLNTTCTVLLVGKVKKWNETFRRNHTFPNLPIGNYTVKVYDGQWYVMEGKDKHPAVQRPAIINSPFKPSHSNNTTTKTPATPSKDKKNGPMRAFGLVVILLAAVSVCH